MKNAEKVLMMFFISLGFFLIGIVLFGNNMNIETDNLSTEDWCIKYYSKVRMQNIPGNCLKYFLEK